MAEGFLSSQPEDIRAELLRYLRKHRDWYENWSRRNKWLWNVLNVAIIALGSVTSVLVAVGDPAAKGSLRWYLAIIFPATAALFSTILVQFRVFEKWRQRESGRIEAEELICEAFLIPVDQDKSTRTAAITVRLKAHELERRQADEHFRQFQKSPP